MGLLDLQSVGEQLLTKVWVTPKQLHWQRWMDKGFSIATIGSPRLNILAPCTVCKANPNISGREKWTELI